MQSTQNFFTRGKLSVVLDQAYGSSGKGRIGSFLMKYAKGSCKFVCNTFSNNASHTIVHRHDEENRPHEKYVYKGLSSCAHAMDEWGIEKMYIGNGAVLDLESFLFEIKLSGIQPHQLGISPLAGISTELDKAYEKGFISLEDSELPKDGKQNHDGTISTGTTASGSGSVRARKVMRNKNLVMAKDIPELEPYICDVHHEIMDRLDAGQSGMMEIAQGFSLSQGLPQHFPYTTSRNCTVSAGLDDMMLPPSIVGNVCINCRTYPIRIHDKKYFAKDDGRHLTWDEVQKGEIEHEVINSYSGDWEDDQEEISWEDMTEIAGSPELLMEQTTLTKLPRRIATFSKKSLVDCIRINNTTGKVFISVNFANYVDWSIYRKTIMTQKVEKWLVDNIIAPTKYMKNVQLAYIGTSEFTEDTIVMNERANERLKDKVSEEDK